MEIIEAFKIIEKNLTPINSDLGFTKSSQDDNCIAFSGDKGAYRVCYDASNSVVSFECAYDNSEDAEFNTLSRSLFDVDAYNERDAKSLANEIADELSSLFSTKKRKDLDKVKMPKAVSRSKAKSGAISYDTDSLANRFGALYPEMKDAVKENIARYDEFLPETFFMEVGTKKVLDVIANGTETERKKLFKMLNEVYEDGTNEVQDIIGVTILGEMKNDAKLMAVADKYMSDYMAGPVHEINKLTSKNKKLIKLLNNPPAYKPKKKKTNFMQNALQAQNQNYNQ